jgi:hypothetical protein
MLTELEKRKMVNLIVQGEGKNTKKILYMPEVKQGFMDILGDEKGEKLQKVLLDLIKEADRLDWVMDPVSRGDDMKRGTFFGGACSVEWE